MKLQSGTFKKGRLLMKLQSGRLKGQAANEATVWKAERAGC